MTTVIVAAAIASSLTLTIDDGLAIVETNDPESVAFYDARPLPLNEIVCLADPAPVDDRTWVRLRRLA